MIKKEVHLLSLVHAYNNLESDLFSRYLEYFQASIKRDELDDLTAFVKIIQKSISDMNVFDNFFIGYEIPQIGKEFDLLRFGKNYTVNIELKSSSTTEKIEKQLKRNNYYLSFLGVEIKSFTFVTNENKLYKINELGDLVEAKFEDVIYLLEQQQIEIIPNVDVLFNPSNYLISPFNSTAEFVAGGYFLTGQQENIKKDAIQKINSSVSTFISISGKAGTGKTLLAYDIAKEYISQRMKVLIIHCGKLNGGHYVLRDKHNWDITPIKDLNQKDLSSYSLLIVDEVQRIYPNQLLDIIKDVKKYNNNCIFSFDGVQCLSTWEIKNNIEDIIANEASPMKYVLTEKIRTNKEIASFIRCFFDKGRRIDNIFQSSNIELHYFKSDIEARIYSQSLREKEWKLINYTPDRKKTFPYEKFSNPGEDNAHGVIGQEFDKVVVIVDSHFYYNSENKLSTKGYSRTPYYHPTKMLFQMMTRTRRKLSIVIIDNIEVMDRCLSILNTKYYNRTKSCSLIEHNEVPNCNLANRKKVELKISL